MIWLYFKLFRPRAVLVAAFFLNLIHPLIHGTPLDSGALDSCIQCLNVTAFTTPMSESDCKSTSGKEEWCLNVDSSH